MPIMRANIAAIISWNAATVDDDGKDNEADDSSYLDQSEDEFD